MTQTATKTQKQVQVLHIYRFKEVARICFEVESSDGDSTYNTCFNGDSQHAACGCEGFAKWHKQCYHIEQLRPIAQAYFDARNAQLVTLPREQEDWSAPDAPIYCEQGREWASLTDDERANRRAAMDMQFNPWLA